MAKRSSQQDMFKKVSPAYGGHLRNTRKGRGARPIGTSNSMHFVLKSQLARNEWSFLRHKRAIREILELNAVKFGVKLNSLANVGNHLHIHLQLTNRHTYKAFIRATSASIMMTITGASRWHTWAKILKERGLSAGTQFWAQRPWSRIVYGFKALLTLKDYIEVNKWEEWGFGRNEARFMVAWNSSRR